MVCIILHSVLKMEQNCNNKYVYCIVVCDFPNCTFFQILELCVRALPHHCFHMGIRSFKQRLTRIRTLLDQWSLTKVQKMPADTLLGIDEKHFADTDTQNLKLRTENVVIWEVAERYNYSWVTEKSYTFVW